MKTHQKIESKKKIQVMLVEDQTVLREGLAAIISLQTDAAAMVYLRIKFHVEVSHFGFARLYNRK